MNKNYQSWIDAIQKNSYAVQITEESALNGALFGFKFPRSVRLKESFDKGEEAATGRAYFFKTGFAEIAKPGKDNRDISWLGAYNHIVTGTHGKSFIPDPVDTPDFAPTKLEINNRLKDWCLKFETIPFVGTSPMKHDPENQDKVIVLLIPSSLANAIEEEPGEKMIEAYLINDGGLLVPSNQENEILRNLLGENPPKTWAEGFELVNKYMLTILKPVLETIPNDSNLIEFTREEVIQKIEQFKQWVHSTFTTLADVVRLDETSKDEEIGRMFTLDFPTSFSGFSLEGSQPGMISFYGDGQAHINFYECTDENEPLKKLQEFAKKPSNWKEAVEKVSEFLNELQKLVPTT